MPMSASEIEKRIKAALPDAVIELRDGGVHADAGQERGDDRADPPFRGGGGVVGDAHEGFVQAGLADPTRYQPGSAPS